MTVRGRNRRQAKLLLLTLMAASGLVACNLLNGSRDRVLDTEEELAPDATAPANPRDTGAPLEPIDATPDPIVDAGDGGVSIRITPLWRTPNQATFVVNADGSTRITAFAANATHPIIVPRAQPTNLPSEDYTVHAVVRAGAESEFGILARVQADGAAVLLSSRYGGEVAPWVGEIRPTEWNPLRFSKGQDYTFVNNTRYRLQLRVIGRSMQGKMWDATKPEPVVAQVSAEGPFSSGKGVGYYTYGAVDATLESLEVTVP